MPAIVVDMDRVTSSLERVAPALTSLIRAAAPDARAIGDWTVWDTAAHLADVWSNYTNVARGGGSAAPTPEGLAEYNQARIEAATGRTLSELADSIDASLPGFLEALRSQSPELEVPWVGGIPVPVATVGTIALSECLLHGFDIARAASLPWRIQKDDAAASVLGLSCLLPHYLDREAAGDLDATFDLRLRGGSRLAITIGRGELRVDDAPHGTVDCHISADPTAFLLVGYGRSGLAGPLLRGQLLAWGRKPWLALRFPALLRAP